MSIGDLRNKIQNQFLRNNIISAAEAKTIVKTVKSESISPAELVKIRSDFKDSFSTSGLKAFDKAAERLGASRPNGNTTSTGNSSSILDMQLGRSLDKIPSSFKLSEVKDRDVRNALSRMDVNSDGKVNSRDRKKMGFSEGQWKMFAFSSMLLGSNATPGAKVPQNLSGKKICFTAVPDKDKLVKWAKEMGATVTTRVSDDLDFLIVGDSSKTGKDERALILNTLGDADIQVSGMGGFLSSAKAAGVTGPAPVDISTAKYEKIVDGSLKSFYSSFIKEGYRDELASASSASERTSLKAAMKSDLDDFDPSMIDPDEYFSDSIEDQYANGEPYLDRFGVPIPEDKLDVINFSFFTELAGIGLSKTFVFDMRNGNLVDEGDIQD